MPKISVIIPAYNAERFIDRAINNVISQSLNDWELIIVDDGSTDGTLCVAKEYNDERIKIIEQANQGVSKARNNGLRNSLGGYIIFLDADDWWDENCLEKLAGTLDKNPEAVIAYGNWAYAGDNGWYGIERVSKFPNEKSLETLVIYNPMVVHCAMVRRDALLNIGGFPEQMPTLEDWELWLKFAIYGYQFLHVPYLLAFYYWHPDSKSKDSCQRKVERLAILDRSWGLPLLYQKLHSLKAKSYASAYIDFCGSCLAENNIEQAFLELDQAISLEPQIISRIDTFYRLYYTGQAPARNTLPGSIETVDERTAVNILGLLLDHMAELSSKNNIKFNMPSVKFSAYYALGLAFYNESKLDLARTFMEKAFRTDPKQILIFKYVWTFYKTYIPLKILNLLRQRRKIFNLNS